MATIKLSNSGTTGAKYPTASADNNYMETIASTLVGAGGASSVTFSNIPQGYKHLQIRALSRSTFAATNTSIVIRMNSDSNSNYSYHSLNGNGTTIGSYGVATDSFAISQMYPGASATASYFGGGVIDILDYANTNKFKTVRSFAGFVGYVALMSSCWRNTAAITTLTLTTDGNFAQYSRLSLYGIKG